MRIDLAAFGVVDALPVTHWTFKPRAAAADAPKNALREVGIAQLPSHLTGAVDHEFLGGELSQAHRPEGVHLGRRDAHLGTQP